MKHFNANESARNRLTADEDAALQRLAIEWPAEWSVEFYGGPKDGLVVRFEQRLTLSPVWDFPAGGVRHFYELVGQRYYYAGAKAVTK